MKTHWMLIAAALVACGLAGCNIDRQAQKKAAETSKLVTDPVQTVGVQTAQQTDLIRSLEITGEVTTSNDSQVGAKTSGKIVAVYVKDGDRVRKGQVLALQDLTPLEAQLNQALSGVLTAQAQMSTARSQLTQAIRNELINPSKSTAGVLSAKAALGYAKANLAKTLAGARPQERRQAEATLRSAKAAMDTQEKELERVRTLVKEGALAGNQLDQQNSAYETALANYLNAKESVDLINQGNRQEDIDAAREQVGEAQQALDTAISTRKLDALYKDQVDSAKAGVDSAKAQIENAKQQVVIARQAIADAKITAPFDGSVSGKPIEVGTIAGPGTTVVRIIGTEGTYFEGNVPSNDVGQIKEGMDVGITVDAVGSTQYPGRVVAISPLGSSVGRLFNVRIQFQGPAPEVRPGMFARGSVQVQTIKNATVVPETAVLRQSGETFLLVADNGKAKKVAVTLGLQQGAQIQVIGLPVGSQVIVQGQDRISNGAPIKVEKPVGAITASPGFAKSPDRGQG